MTTTNFNIPLGIWGCKYDGCKKGENELQERSWVTHKSFHVFSNVVCSDFSVVCLTKTWPCSTISDDNYFPPDVKVYRKDRKF